MRGPSQIHAGDGLARTLAHPSAGDRRKQSGRLRPARTPEPGAGRETPGACDVPDPWPEQDPNWPFIAPAPPRIDRGPIALAILIAAFLATAGVVVWQAKAAAHRGELVTLTLRKSI